MRLKALAINIASCAPSIVVVALIAGCTGSQVPVGVPATRAVLGRSWMQPAAQSADLLYLTNDKTVTVYSYPKGRLVGQLTGFGILGGDCVDSAGDVWIIDNQMDKLYEYSHGGTTPIATLTPPGDPLYCSVNPKNGDLAVGTGSFVVAIYRHGRGNPSSYSDSAFEGFFSSSYDQGGNLFVDGVSSVYHFEFAELPKSGNALKNISLNQSFEGPGGVQAIGNSVFVGDSNTGAVYQFRISGSMGTEIGSTQLDFGGATAFEFVIRGNRLIAPLTAFSENEAAYFQFPLGGAATKTITKDVVAPTSVAISLGVH